MFSSSKKQRALKEIELRRNRRETYTEPLPSNAADMKEFLMFFYRDVLFHRTTISEECNLYQDTVKVHYNEIVLQQKLISYEDFWQRYFYRTSSVDRVIQEMEQKDAEMKQHQRSSSSSNPSLLPTWMMYANSNINTSSPPRTTAKPSTPPHPTPTVTPAPDGLSIPTPSSPILVDRNPVDLIPQRVLATTASSPSDIRIESSNSGSLRKTNFLDLLPKRKNTATSNTRGSAGDDSPPIISNKKPMPDPETVSTQPLILKLDDASLADPLLLKDFPKQKDDDTLVGSSALEEVVASASSSSLMEPEDDNIRFSVDKDVESVVKMTKTILYPNATIANPTGVMQMESEASPPDLIIPVEAKKDVFSLPTLASPLESEVAPPEVHLLDQAQERATMISTQDSVIHKALEAPMDSLPKIELTHRPVDESEVSSNVVAAVSKDTQELLSMQQSGDGDEMHFRSSAELEAIKLIRRDQENELTQNQPSGDDKSSTSAMGEPDLLTGFLANVPESDRAYLSNFMSVEELQCKNPSSEIEFPPSLSNEPATDVLDVPSTSTVEFSHSDQVAFVTSPGQVSLEDPRTPASQSDIDTAFSAVNPFDDILAPKNVVTDTLSSTVASFESAPFSPDLFHSWEGSMKDQNPFAESTSKEIQDAFDPFRVGTSIDQVSTANISDPADTISSFATLSRASFDEFVSSADVSVVVPTSTQLEETSSSEKTNFLSFANPFKYAAVDALPSKSVPSITKAEGVDIIAGIAVSNDGNVLASTLDVSSNIQKEPDDMLKSRTSTAFMNLFKFGVPEVATPEADPMESKTKLDQDVDTVFSKPTDEFTNFSSITADESLGDGQSSESVPVNKEVEMQTPTLGARFSSLFGSKKRKQVSGSSDAVELEKGPPSLKHARRINVPDSQSKQGDISTSLTWDQPSDSLKHEDVPNVKTSEIPKVSGGFRNFFRSISGKDDSDLQQSDDMTTKVQLNEMDSAVPKTLPKEVVQNSGKEGSKLLVEKAVVPDSRAVTPVTSNIDLAAADRSGIENAPRGIQFTTKANLLRCAMLVAIGIFISMIRRHPENLVSVVNGLCGPVRPGWTSSSSILPETLHAEAPFWVPVAGWKPAIFRAVCGIGRTRTILKLTAQKSGDFTLDLLEADSEKSVSLMKKKQLKAVLVKWDNIELTNSRGKSVLLYPVWTQQHLTNSIKM